MRYKNPSPSAAYISCTYRLLTRLLPECHRDVVLRRGRGTTYCLWHGPTQKHIGPGESLPDGPCRIQDFLTYVEREQACRKSGFLCRTSTATPRNTIGGSAMPSPRPGSSQWQVKEQQPRPLVSRPCWNTGCPATVLPPRACPPAWSCGTAVQNADRELRANLSASDSSRTKPDSSQEGTLPHPCVSTCLATGRTCVTRARQHVESCVRLEAKVGSEASSWRSLLEHAWRSRDWLKAGPRDFL